MRRIVVTLALLSSAQPARAQWGVWPADSLLAAGRLESADSAYYAAARVRPRDPIARAALGRYLAARSATKVGAVLLEEARRFGGDSARLASALVALYERAHDYRALVALEPNVLTAAERGRARWLSTHPPEMQLRDSIAILTYRPLGDGAGLGTVLLRLGRTETPAVIDPRVSGMVLPSRFRRDVQEFGSAGKRMLAVARSVRLGGVIFTNISATVTGPNEPVRIGFDVLAPYSPTFDPRAGLLTLRRTDRRSRTPPGLRMPALFDASGLRVLVGSLWQPTTSSNAALMLATRKWMWDDRRGDIVLLP